MRRSRRRSSPAGSCSARWRSIAGARSGRRAGARATSGRSLRERARNGPSDRAAGREGQKLGTADDLAKQWLPRYRTSPNVARRCCSFRRASKTAHVGTELRRTGGPPPAKASRSKFVETPGRQPPTPPGRQPDHRRASRWTIEATALDLGHRRAFARGLDGRARGAWSLRAPPPGPSLAPVQISNPPPDSSTPELAEPAEKQPAIASSSFRPPNPTDACAPPGPKAEGAPQRTRGLGESGSEANVPRTAPRLRHPRMAHRGSARQPCKRPVATTGPCGTYALKATSR